MLKRSDSWLTPECLSILARVDSRTGSLSHEEPLEPQRSSPENEIGIDLSQDAGACASSGWFSKGSVRREPIRQLGMLVKLFEHESDDFLIPQDLGEEIRVPVIDPPIAGVQFLPGDCRAIKTTPAALAGNDVQVLVGEWKFKCRCDGAPVGGVQVPPIVGNRDGFAHGQVFRSFTVFAGILRVECGKRQAAVVRRSLGRHSCTVTACEQIERIAQDQQVEDGHVRAKSSEYPTIDAVVEDAERVVLETDDNVVVGGDPIGWQKGFR